MKKILLPTLVLFVICLTVAALLFGGNALTAERIAEVERAALEKAAKDVLPAAVTVELISRDDVNGYYGYDADGRLVGYSFRTSAKGYGGAVHTVVGMDLEGKITGVIVKAADETPGLGNKVTKDDFTDQFTDMMITDGFVLKQNVTAVTGASYSSEAVAAGLRLAGDYYALMKEETVQ